MGSTYHSCGFDIKTNTSNFSREGGGRGGGRWRGSKPIEISFSDPTRTGEWPVHTQTKVWPISLIKKKIKFSRYIGKFRMEQLQSHI
jgi:hypothetical protein